MNSKDKRALKYVLKKCEYWYSNGKSLTKDDKESITNVKNCISHILSSIGSDNEVCPMKKYSDLLDLYRLKRQSLVKLEYRMNICKKYRNINLIWAMITSIMCILLIISKIF